jgi:hypothetical protein
VALRLVVTDSPNRYTTEDTGMTVRAAWLTTRGDAAGGQTRNDTRMTPLGAMVPAAELTTVSGVIPGGDPFALAATGPMTATLGTGRAVVQGTDIQGAYPVAVTVPETLTFADGDPANPRIDLVVVRVYDAAHDESGQTLVTVEAIAGTPGAAPEPPPTPPAALALYRVAIPAGASAGSGGIDLPAATTDVRSYSVAAGGISPSTTTPGAYRAQYRDDGTGLQRWSSTSWVGMVRELIPWTTARLASPAYEHGGGRQGDVRYRVIELLGTRFVQWRGGMTVSYTAGAPARDGNFLSADLPVAARPAGPRALPVACSTTTSTVLALHIVFQEDGRATLTANAGDTPPWVSFNGVTYPL